MDQRIKILIAVLTSSVAVAIAARECRTVHLVEAEKRAKIQREMHLDLQAIKTASAVLNERIDRGEIRSLDQLIGGLQNEIAFQKIAIREQ